MPKSEILPLFNFSLIPIYLISILAGRKDKRNDLKKKKTLHKSKFLILGLLDARIDLSLTFKTNEL